MELQLAFNIAVALVAGLGGWVLRAITGRIDELQRSKDLLMNKVQAMEVLVAGQYVKREDLDKMGEAIFKKLDRIEGKIFSVNVSPNA